MRSATPTHRVPALLLRPHARGRSLVPCRMRALFLYFVVPDARRDLAVRDNGNRVRPEGLTVFERQSVVCVWSQCIGRSAMKLAGRSVGDRRELVFIVFTVFPGLADDELLDLAGSVEREFGNAVPPSGCLLR